MSIGAESVDSLIAGIAGTDPAPGAGAAGAVALALGIACACKAVRLTLVHHPERAQLAAADTRLAALAEAACAGADADAARFTALIAALKLPHDAPDETEARAEAVAERSAALVSLAGHLIGLGRAAARLCDAVADQVRPAMANDILAARALIAAAAAISDANLAESRERAG